MFLSIYLNILEMIKHYKLQVKNDNIDRITVVKLRYYKQMKKNLFFNIMIPEEINYIDLNK